MPALCYRASCPPPSTGKPCKKVRLSTGGQRIRLVFLNRYGSRPVQLGAVRVGRAGDAGPGQLVAFDGEARVSILPGATVSSDALPMPV